MSEAGQKSPPSLVPGGDGCSPVSRHQNGPREAQAVASGVPALLRRLQRGEEVNRLGCFRRGGEDRFRVGLHDAEPMIEILRVIGARLSW